VRNSPVAETKESLPSTEQVDILRQLTAQWRESTAASCPKSLSLTMFSPFLNGGFLKKKFDGNDRIAST
jgi:hypothetical protein